MVAEQTGQKPRVFISYSRVDSDFAYRLRADLEASGFDTWIDTTKLGDQGGQEWLRIIQDAVDASQAMVVAVSPDSVQSKYVHMEYHRAQSQNKLVIPLHYRTVTSAPMDLDLAQWLEFREDQGGPDAYQIGLTNLIRSLSRAPQPPKLAPLPQAPSAPTAPLTIAEGADMPEFRPVSPAPPEPSPDVQELIAGMFDARGRDDLVSEEYFLSKIVESGDSQAGPRYADRLAIVTAELERQRVARLRELAAQAVEERQWRRALGAWQALSDIVPNDGSAIEGIRDARMERARQALSESEFDEAVGAWQALLRTEPQSHEVEIGLRAALRARADDAWAKGDWTRAAESWETLNALTPPEPEAQAHLDALDQNRREAYNYQTAQRLLASDNVPAAHAALQEIYAEAPYYGDPAGIATQLAIIVPPSLGAKLHARNPEPLSNEDEQHLQLAEIANTEQESKKTPAELSGQVALRTNSSASISTYGEFLLVATINVAFYNYLGTAIISAIRAGKWWTAAMVANSWMLLWMSLLLYAGLLISFEALAVLLAALVKRWGYTAGHYGALTLAGVCATPGCWLIAIWLYTGLRNGVGWEFAVGTGVWALIAAIGLTAAILNYFP